MRPIIGLLAEVDDERATRVMSTYVRAIEKSGGAPFLLPYVEGEEVVRHLALLCDGFLFTGGADISPMRYGEKAKESCGKIQLYRDDLEFRMFAQIYQTKKPILAICRGAQLVNVALGGTLFQDIPSECPSEIPHRQAEPKFSFSHSVSIQRDTPLYALIGKERMRANSFHHQAIKKLGSGLSVMAIADDGVIEAVYSTENRYLRAYQWHPERLCERCEDNKLLFENFIRACAAKKELTYQ